MDKKRICVLISCISIFIIFFSPLIVLGERTPFVSRSMPTDKLIIEVANELECAGIDEIVNQILGKLPTSENTWELYYRESREKGHIYERGMRLIHLDTNVWILDCSNDDFENWMVIQKN